MVNLKGFNMFSGVISEMPLLLPDMGALWMHHSISLVSILYPPSSILQLTNTTA